MRDLARLLQAVPGIKSVDLGDVRRLVKLLRDSPEVGSIEVKGWFGTGVVVTRAGSGAVSVNPAPAVAPPAPHAASASAPAPASAPSAAPTALNEITSPMVGNFYRATEPGAEPYVSVGTRLTAGQTVCIIEAMKIMNEIEAELSGVIREVCVEDAQPVEYGQVLFRVDPNG
ncbi:MAG: acetyl-CoA carboxylase biotin carboxyl carrier protein [Gemmatimonadales bacterium]|nr:acetyl-CoA carboxylase biotin carboxyl carrier protein [Gemmatimonadales bacterium]